MAWRPVFTVADWVIKLFSKAAGTPRGDDEFGKIAKRSVAAGDWRRRNALLRARERRGVGRTGRQADLSHDVDVVGVVADVGYLFGF